MVLDTEAHLIERWHYQFHSVENIDIVMIHLYSNGIAFIAKNIRVCNYKFDAASLPYSNFFVDFYAFKSRKKAFLFLSLNVAQKLWIICCRF